MAESELALVIVQFIINLTESRTRGECVTRSVIVLVRWDYYSSGLYLLQRRRRHGDWQHNSGTMTQISRKWSERDVASFILTHFLRCHPLILGTRDTLWHTGDTRGYVAVWSWDTRDTLCDVCHCVTNVTHWRYSGCCSWAVWFCDTRDTAWHTDKLIY